MIFFSVSNVAFLVVRCRDIRSFPGMVFTLSNLDSKSKGLWIVAHWYSWSNSLRKYTKVTMSLHTVTMKNICSYHSLQSAGNGNNPSPVCVFMVRNTYSTRSCSILIYCWVSQFFQGVHYSPVKNLEKDILSFFSESFAHFLDLQIPLCDLYNDILQPFYLIIFVWFQYIILQVPTIVFRFLMCAFWKHISHK